ncbi:hypothetical protein A1Q2_04933 [Trichosporon asahii var. asahii CBS 8904]|uniref:Uncharacterized protein n=1 Tax=Trichosporon asahii var. asahii (strain CBS 8904) TaxID=1220162 RepID=K1VIZ8_TRIAC|nr:hypothetical protein A1Q2_04933 [Trichosporon asahii var. asahii CBS 8904]
MSSFMGGGHRSSSDRLLQNYMYGLSESRPRLVADFLNRDSQKGLTTALLTLLSHSHTSTSSLLAYVTSSPGVLLPIRRAVRHAAFEGPLSPGGGESAHGGTSSIAGDGENLGWAAYVSSLEDFRKNLKKIHELEEEMSRVKRDRQILVSRLIKTTKSRPTKRDIKDMSSSLSSNFRQNDGGSVLSSTGSAYSYSSDVSGHISSREAKRAQKMQEAQAELLGCEEHLRSLEVRIETERNKVMYSGLEERFHAMEAVGQMWIGQARRGLQDLEKLPADAGDGQNYELESNASLAPSQSASQMGYDERDFSPAAHKHSRSLTAGRRPVARGPGSINESIAEEEEGGGSSEDEQPPTNLVMHENTRVTEANLRANNASNSPSVSRRHSHTGSKTTGRKATSELGTGGTYKPPGTRSLRRTRSSDHGLSRVDEQSDTSSIRANTSAYHRGKERDKKKHGFFSSIARFFKGPHHEDKGNRSGRESPYRKGAWHTRTDDNIKRAKSSNPRTRRADSSSDEESLSNYDVVANQPNAPSWTVADVGRVSVNHGTHPGLVRSPSTKARSHAGSATPRAAMSVVSKTPTVKSNKSNRSSGKPKTRPNGSIGRTSKRVSSPPGRADNSMMSIVDAPAPTMPDVPKAPSVGPQMELAKAPGSSLVGDRQQPNVQHTARHSTHRLDLALQQHEDGPLRSWTPDQVAQAPLLGQLRQGSRRRPPPFEAEAASSEVGSAPHRSRPGPVHVDDKDVEPKKPEVAGFITDDPKKPEIAGLITDDPNDQIAGFLTDGPDVKPDNDRPRTKSRTSYTTGATGDSVYESAEDDGSRQYNDANVDDDATEVAGYQPSGYSDGNDLARRKSVRVHVPGEAPAPAPAPASNTGDGYRETKTTHYVTPVAADSAPRESMDSDELAPRKAPADWGTRIGRMREDTSSEEDELDPAYAKARKHLIKNDGNFDKIKTKSKSKSGKSSSSIRSKGSSRSKSSRK